MGDLEKIATIDGLVTKTFSNCFWIWCSGTTRKAKSPKFCGLFVVGSKTPTRASTGVARSSRRARGGVGAHDARLGANLCLHLNDCSSSNHPTCVVLLWLLLLPMCICWHGDGGQLDNPPAQVRRVRVRRCIGDKVLHCQDERFHIDFPFYKNRCIGLTCSALYQALARPCFSFGACWGANLLAMRASPFCPKGGRNLHTHSGQDRPLTFPSCSPALWSLPTRYLTLASWHCLVDPGRLGNGGPRATGIDPCASAPTGSACPIDRVQSWSTSPRGHVFHMGWPTCACAYARTCACAYASA